MQSTDSVWPLSNYHGIFHRTRTKKSQNLYGDTKDLYSLKTLMKEIKDDTNRWRDIPCSRIERIHIVKWLYYPKQPTKSMQSLSNHQWHFSQNYNKIFLQSVWKHKRSQRAKGILRKENGAGGIKLPDFRWYHKARVIKTVWCWQKNRNIHQWNRTESSEINSCTYGHLTFDKGGKNTQWRKESLFYK